MNDTLSVKDSQTDRKVRGLGVYLRYIGQRLTAEPMFFEHVRKHHADAGSAYNDEQMERTMDRLVQRGIARRVTTLQGQGWVRGELWCEAAARNRWEDKPDASGSLPSRPKTFTLGPEDEEVIAAVTKAATAAFAPNALMAGDEAGDIGASRSETIKTCAALVTFLRIVEGQPYSPKVWREAIENLKITIR